MLSAHDTELAHELAVALNDRLSIGLYRKFAAAVPHDVLRDALQRTLSVKDEKVIVNRAAIFTSTIIQYLHDIHANPRD
jgi:hypothetical protein